MLLTETVKAVGLDVALSQALGPWRKPATVHDPGKIIVDLALSLGLGGDGLNDARLLRAEPAVFGLVASDPTISRTISVLAGQATKVLPAIRQARAQVRRRAWGLAGRASPQAEATASTPMIIDVDATLITSHSDKQGAGPTWKKGYGFHPLVAFIDHGQEGTGEPLAVMLRKGNAGSNTVADHQQVINQALAQLPSKERKNVLIRTDGAGGTKGLATWLTRRGLNYSLGFTLPEQTPELYQLLPQMAWTPAVTADGDIRDGAEVAEFTRLLDMTGWPANMRVIVRRERPHPGAQLRFDDVDGFRLTAFVTNTRIGQHQHLEARHRTRARVEDRIRASKDLGLAKMPFHRFAQNQIWCEIVTLACELIAWMQTLALHGGHARRWEPKTLRHRLFTIPAVIARKARQTWLHLGRHSPFADLISQGVHRLRHQALVPT